MNTKEKFVITVSRELGSGGHTIARKLAERLQVRLCDKELIKELCEKEGVTIVMTTHDVGLMEFGDQVYELEGGRLTHDEEE